MAAKKCPNCLMWVTDEERMTGQCPGCKSFFESKLPGASSGYSPAATGAPIIQTRTSESPTSRAKRGAGAWHAWWMIPLALFGMRGCLAAVRMEDRRPKYDQVDLDAIVPRIDAQKLGRMRQENKEAREALQSHEFTMGPDSEFESTPADVDPFDVELPDPDPFEKLELPPE